MWSSIWKVNHYLASRPPFSPLANLPEKLGSISLSIGEIEPNFGNSKEMTILLLEIEGSLREEHTRTHRVMKCGL